MIRNTLIKNKALLSQQRSVIILRGMQLQTEKWAMKSALPSAITDELKQKSRETILDYERIYTADVFGSVESLSDGCISYFLAITGIWFWLRHSLKRFNKSYVTVKCGFFNYICS